MTGLAVVVSTMMLTGMGGCDTRFPQDVEGVVVAKSNVEFIGGKDFESHNPSLVIEKIDGTQVRVWLKQQYWDGYDVNDHYP